MTDQRKTLLFNRSSFASLMNMQDYIDAVEAAHRLHAEGKVIAPNLVHADAPNGEYHIKTGGLLGENAYYGLKANGGFFNNKTDYGLPNILGIIYLSDALNAYPLAIFASSLISKMRTAAATAVAAKYLKPNGPIRIGIIGYGNQADAQIEALACVAPIESIKVAGRDASKLQCFVEEQTQKMGIPVEAVDTKELCLSSNIIVTCTPSKQALVKKEWIQKGTFIAAVGADSPGKQELDPEIMPLANIVGDVKSQIIKVGESQHAIQQKLIAENDIYAELGELIIGKKKGRVREEEIFVYDSTGTALQDVAAAACIYEKLKNNPAILSIDLFS